MAALIRTSTTVELDCTVLLACSEFMKYDNEILDGSKSKHYQCACFSSISRIGIKLSHFLMHSQCCYDCCDLLTKGQYENRQSHEQSSVHTNNRAKDVVIYFKCFFFFFRVGVKFLFTKLSGH